MNNETIELLSHTSLWLIAREFASNTQFWYLRTQHLLEEELTYYPGDWKEAYYYFLPILECMDDDDKCASLCKLITSELIMLIQLDLGVDPSHCNNALLAFAAESGYTIAVRMLLQDERVDPSSEDSIALLYAVRYGHVEVVKLLLDDGRVDLTAGDNYAITRSCKHGYTEIVRLLLSNSRVDPTVQDNYALKRARTNGHLEVVELLLQDRRVRSVDEKMNNKTRVQTREQYNNLLAKILLCLLVLFILRLLI